MLKKHSWSAICYEAKKTGLIKIETIYLNSEDHVKTIYLNKNMKNMNITNKRFVSHRTDSQKNFQWETFPIHIFLSFSSVLLVYTIL